MKIKELFPSLRVKDAPAAIDFYKRVFGATERLRLVEPNGRVGHAELVFGDTVVMLSDEFPEYDIYAPQGQRPEAVSIHLHVDDADDFVARAVAAGATVVRPLQDEFYGERGGTVRDPYGHHWNIGHTIEELSAEEMQRRYTALCSGG